MSEHHNCDTLWQSKESQCVMSKYTNIDFTKTRPLYVYIWYICTMCEPCSNLTAMSKAFLKAQPKQTIYWKCFVFIIINSATLRNHYIYFILHNSLLLNDILINHLFKSINNCWHLNGVKTQNTKLITVTWITGLLVLMVPVTYYIYYNDVLIIYYLYFMLLLYKYIIYYA